MSYGNIPREPSAPDQWYRVSFELTVENLGLPWPDVDSRGLMTFIASRFVAYVLKDLPEGLTETGEKKIAQTRVRFLKVQPIDFLGDDEISAFLDQQSETPPEE